MHRKEKEWLQGKVNGEQNHLRNEYLKARAAYSKAVKRAKRVYQRNRCEQQNESWSAPKAERNTPKNLKCDFIENNTVKYKCYINNTNLYAIL